MKRRKCTPSTARRPRARRTPQAPPAAAALPASEERVWALLGEILQLAVSALGHGMSSEDVFFALQHAALVVPMAEGVPPEVATRLASDAASVAADGLVCREIAEDIGHWLEKIRPPTDDFV